MWIIYCINLFWSKHYNFITNALLSLFAILLILSSTDSLLGWNIIAVVSGAIALSFHQWCVWISKFCFGYAIFEVFTIGLFEMCSHFPLKESFILFLVLDLILSWLFVVELDYKFPKIYISISNMLSIMYQSSPSDKLLMKQFFHLEYVS